MLGIGGGGRVRWVMNGLLPCEYACAGPSCQLTSILARNPPEDGQHCWDTIGCNRNNVTFDRRSLHCWRQWLAWLSAHAPTRWVIALPGGATDSTLECSGNLGSFPNTQRSGILSEHREIWDPLQTHRDLGSSPNTERSGILSEHRDLGSSPNIQRSGILSEHRHLGSSPDIQRSGILSEHTEIWDHLRTQRSGILSEHTETRDSLRTHRDVRSLPWKEKSWHRDKRDGNLKVYTDWWCCVRLVSRRLPYIETSGEILGEVKNLFKRIFSTQSECRLKNNGSTLSGGLELYHLWNGMLWLKRASGLRLRHD